ncbi:MAG: family ATPase, partial [Chloroflexi bacterium]|nr:family ATPase [Chloroflexota bacterium]
MPQNETRVEALLDRGFRMKKSLRYFERHIPVQREELTSLAQLGGRVLPRDLWESVGGMEREKEL